MQDGHHTHGFRWGRLPNTSVLRAALRRKVGLVSFRIGVARNIAPAYQSYEELDAACVFENVIFLKGHCYATGHEL